jgi:hypothetical protein
LPSALSPVVFSIAIAQSTMKLDAITKFLTSID